MKNNELLAVHDDDLTTLLKSLEKYDEVIAGKCACIFCEKQIELDNIGAIVPGDKKIVFSCNANACLNILTKLGEQNDGRGN